MTHFSKLPQKDRVVNTKFKPANIPASAEHQEDNQLSPDAINFFSYLLRDIHPILTQDMEQLNSELNRLQELIGKNDWWESYDSGSKSQPLTQHVLAKKVFNAANKLYKDGQQSDSLTAQDKDYLCFLAGSFFKLGRIIGEHNTLIARENAVQVARAAHHGRKAGGGKMNRWKQYIQKLAEDTWQKYPDVLVPNMSKAIIIHIQKKNGIDPEFPTANTVRKYLNDIAEPAQKVSSRAPKQEFTIVTNLI